MEANTDPVTEWVTGPGADRGAPAPPVRRPGRVRRKLAAAVKDGTAAAAARVHPHDPDPREHLAAVLLESDSETWPLVDGTDLADLVPAVRDWLSATGAVQDAPEDAEDPIVVALSVAIIEAVRTRFVRDGDEALGQIWFDFEEASGIDLARLEAVPFHEADDETDGSGEAEEEPEEIDPELGEFRSAHLRRRRISPMPWALMLTGFGIVLSTARLLDTGGPGWTALAIGAAAVGFLIGWGRTAVPRDSASVVESLEVYERGVIVNPALGRPVTVRPARLWAPEREPFGERTLMLVWPAEGRSEPVFTDLSGFTEPQVLKRSLTESEFVRDRTPIAEVRSGSRRP